MAALADACDQQGHPQVTLFVSIFKLFTGLLQLLGLANGSD